MITKFTDTWKKKTRRQHISGSENLTVQAVDSSQPINLMHFRLKSEWDPLKKLDRMIEKFIWIIIIQEWSRNFWKSNITSGDLPCNVEMHDKLHRGTRHRIGVIN